MAQPSTLTVTPRLVDLVADPSKVALLPLETIATLRGELTKLDTLLLGRLLSEAKGRTEAGVESDRLLTAREAAAKLGASQDWLYRHSRNLPFTVRMGRKVLFSEAGIARYIRARMGR